MPIVHCLLKCTYKYTSVDEIKGVLESIVLFVSKHNRKDGVNLFTDNNLNLWKEVGSRSTSPFITSLSAVVQ